MNGVILIHTKYKKSKKMTSGTNKYVKASLAQSVERQTLNLKVAGSTPAWGFLFALFAEITSMFPRKPVHSM
jgi:hypothetical protein